MQKNKTISLAEKLISIPSITGNIPEIKKSLKTIKAFLAEKNISTKTLQKNESPILWATNQDFDNPKLLILCHTDVVKARKQAFSPNTSKGKLFGRGAIDMKGPLAAMISALSNTKTKEKIHLVITSDEEIGGHNGAKWFFNTTKTIPKIAIVPDSIDGNNLVIKQKGPTHLIIKAQGKSCHASQPWSGKNPVEELIKIKNKINKLKKQAQTNKEWLPTITITNISAESSINQIASLAEMTLDIRTTEKELLPKIREIIKNYNAKIKKSHGDNKIFNQGLTSSIKLWQKITQQTTGSKPKTISSCGASDARHIPKKTKTIITSALGGNAHGEKEWIDIKSLLKLEKTTQKFIKKI